MKPPHSSVPVHAPAASGSHQCIGLSTGTLKGSQGAKGSDFFFRLFSLKYLMELNTSSAGQHYEASWEYNSISGKHDCLLTSGSDCFLNNSPLTEILCHSFSCHLLIASGRFLICWDSDITAVDQDHPHWSSETWKNISGLREGRKNKRLFYSKNSRSISRRVSYENITCQGFS